MTTIFIESSLGAVSELKKARLAAGMSATDTAASLGHLKTNFSRWECGYSEPRLTTLIRWSRFLGYRLAFVPDERRCVHGFPVTFLRSGLRRCLPCRKKGAT